MKYVVVYDIARESVNMDSLYALFFGVAVAVFIFFIKKKSLWSTIFTIVWLVFWVTTWSSIFIHQKSELQECKSLLSSGQFKVVDGVVENFHGMPKTGHDTERFTVNGVNFSYSDYDESHCGFNNTLSHGGPIHAGSNVRLSYAGNRILKVEIAK